MIKSGNEDSSLAGLENTKRPSPGQGAEPACRCSPGSSATIPVSKGWMPDLVLAHSAVVLENGQADPGTGHTPASNPGQLQVSTSRFWTDYRRENQEPLPPALNPNPVSREPGPANQTVAAKGTVSACI